MGQQLTDDRNPCVVVHCDVVAVRGCRHPLAGYALSKAGLGKEDGDGGRRGLGAPLVFRGFGRP
jgi:hypothetical protein